MRCFQMQQQAKQVKIPFDETDDTEKRKRRKKWVDFVKLKRALWEPMKYLAVCSKHFLDEDYSVMFSDLAKIDFQRRLRKDGIGIWVFFFRWKVNKLKASEGDNKICIHVL